MAGSPVSGEVGIETLFDSKAMGVLSMWLPIYGLLLDSKFMTV